MTQLEYHKGSFCYLTSVYCGQGYRVDCRTCIRTKIFAGQETLKGVTGDVRLSPEVAGAGMPS
jgi:hypothetical protein